MTKIRAQCPTCGDVEFGVEAIVVLGERVNSDEPEEPARAPNSRLTGAYRFSCPLCDSSVRRAALPEVIQLLVTAGVAVDFGSGRTSKAARRGRPSVSPTARQTRRSGPAPDHPFGPGSLTNQPDSSPDTGPAPFSDADIEAFRHVMARPDWFERLQSSGD